MRSETEFSLERFLKAMDRSVRIFPDEYSGYDVEPIAAWIDNDYVKVVFESRPHHSEKKALWAFAPYRPIHSPQTVVPESEITNAIFFDDMAGDYPALFNKPDGVHIDWRNTSGKGEPQTLAEVEDMPGVVYSRK